MAFFNNPKILFFFIFTIIFSINSDEPNKNDKISAKKEDKKQKTTKGYFGKKTHYFDKDGKPKLLYKDFKSLTFEELQHNREIHKEKKDLETLIRYTERMVAICKDQIMIGKLRLELADYYFDAQRLDKASAAYAEFIKMYPGNENVEYATCRMILSQYAQTLTSDRDQMQTRDTIKSAKEFLTNSSYTKYRPEVIKVINKCNTKLLDAELNSFNFYINKNNAGAAEKRLEYIKEHFQKNPKLDQSLINELEEQIKAVKEKRTYKPKYKITSNASILDSIPFMVKSNDDDLLVKKDCSKDKKPKKPYVERF